MSYDHSRYSLAAPIPVETPDWSRYDSADAVRRAYHVIVDKAQTERAFYGRTRRHTHLLRTADLYAERYHQMQATQTD